mmetsp:Transcript_1960/g.5451  ORF Transcript_1960/g.5451 Transcript_1960/m.5451 type:complete len:107 (+) Transcript_1960:58-378(+)
MSRAGGRHTILLLQKGDTKSRTYLDFESMTQAYDYVVGMYEQRLKELNPSRKHMEYDVTDLFAFMDALTDLSALVYHPESGMYEPGGKEWLKGQIFEHLKKAAGGR